MLDVTKKLDVNELTLRELVQVLRLRAIFVICCTILCGFASGLAAYIAPKWYQATVVLSPVDTTSNGVMGAVVNSQLGGLAALAGLSSGGDSKKSESIAVLQSEALTEKYVAQNQLLPILFENEWNTTVRNWIKPSEPPTLWKANQLFKKSLRTITIDGKTGIVTLRIEWKDSKLAAIWANGLVQLTNEYLRSKAIAESERNVAYLGDQAAKTNILEVKNAIYSILEGEVKKAMLARGSEEYAFRIIDPAQPSEKQSSPLKTVWIVVGLFAGFFISAAGVLIHSSWK